MEQEAVARANTALTHELKHACMVVAALVMVFGVEQFLAHHIFAPRPVAVPVVFSDSFNTHPPIHVLVDGEFATLDAGGCVRLTPVPIHRIKAYWPGGATATLTPEGGNAAAVICPSLEGVEKLNICVGKGP